jgi:threonine dehydratase
MIPSPDEIASARRLIQPYLRITPVLALEPGVLGPPVVVKLELTQRGGSFKIRGAFANLLLRQVPAAGVVAASGGNHGVAVSYAARLLGVPATIFVPTISAPAKVAAIRALGADLHIGGDRYADALDASAEFAASSGALPVHAYDGRETILGQGSLGLELLEQVPDVDTVLVPVGGGGLIAGIAAAIGARVKVVGVEPEGAPTLFDARAAGQPVDAPVGSVAADALAPRRVGELVFPITQDRVAEVVLVSDEAILAAQQTLWREARIVAEPAGSVGAAAIQSGAYRPAPGERVAVVVSGANTDPASVVSTST